MMCWYIPSPFSPDDHSRVILSVPDSTGNDYINASFIDVSVMQFECTLTVPGPASKHEQTPRETTHTCIHAYGHKHT